MRNFLLRRLTRDERAQPTMAATAAGRAAVAGASSIVRSAAASSSAASSSSSSKGWLVYMVETRGGKLYTGITVSLRRRMEQHAGLRTGGAKAFRADPPARLRYAETAANRADATRREMALKRLARADKLALIQSAMLHDRDEDSGGAWGRPLSPEELAASDPFARDRSSHDKKTTKPDQ